MLNAYITACASACGSCLGLGIFVLGHTIIHRRLKEDRILVFTLFGASLILFLITCAFCMI